MRVAERWFDHEPVGDGVVRITEPNVDPFLRANLFSSEDATGTC